MRVVIAGSGKIGTLAALRLAEEPSYEVTVIDKDLSGSDLQRALSTDVMKRVKTQIVDVTDAKILSDFIQQEKITAIISCLPFHLNKMIAPVARDSGIHYFDLTEDRQSTAFVKKIAEGAETAFVPQCGLAPGYISIVAHHLMQDFAEIESVKLRVGALPQYSANALHYALTWSTDGLINEYCHPSEVIVDHDIVLKQPLTEVESIHIEGEVYEAFHTSGGLGSLAELTKGRVANLDYKTLRYPGHCEKMRFLLHDLKLRHDRETLKRILENAIPKTYDDMVIIYVSVAGKKAGAYLKTSEVKKCYPRTRWGMSWSAIQWTTVTGLLTVVDIVMTSENKYKGLVYQENIPLIDFMENRFADYYREAQS